jgi:TonB-dependent receptor
LSGPASLQNPASYNLTGITLQARASQDQEHHLRWDLSRKFALGESDTTLKFGSKWSRREKQNDTEQWAYNSNKVGNPNYWGAGPTSLANFIQGPLDYPFATLGPGINPTLIRERVANLERAPARLLQESVLNDYRMHEDIDAAYLQSSTTLGNWQVLLGLRYEHSAFSARGNQVQGSTISAISRERSFGNWLPNLQMRYDLAQHTSIRAALTHSVVRANFSQLAPGINLVSNTEAVIGNPDLKPLQARNLDLGMEHLLGREGAISAYVFNKDIKNFTYTTDLAGSGPWANYSSAVSYANGDTARLSGLELSYSQALRMLPAPWNGVILGANATFTQAHANISRFDKASGRSLSREISLPGQSRRMLNLTVGYETGPVSARLALNYKSPYLLELGNDILNPAQDRIVDQQKQLDFSLSYQLTPKLQLLLEGSNLNNEKYYVYQGSKPLNAQYEAYGRTWKISLKASVF